MVQEMMIDDSGWLVGVEKIPSPNFEPRPESATIKLIVVHAISLPPGIYGGNYVQQFFTNQLDAKKHAYFTQIHQMRVSAHCFISREGEIQQFVSFDDRAWHAGESSWQGESGCNDFSIGIELEGCDDDMYETAQYDQLARIIVSLKKNYPEINDDALCGHCDIAPQRKTDPGPNFDWVKLGQILQNLS